MVWKDPFVQMIANEADRQFGRAFIPRAGEGRAMESPPDGLEVENWSGWLVPPERGEEARSHMPMNFDWFDSQGFDFVWVTWSVNDDQSIAIHFVV